LFVFRTDLLTQDKTLNADAYLATCVLKDYVREAIRCGKLREAQNALTHLAAGLTGVDMATAESMDVRVIRGDPTDCIGETSVTGPISGLAEDLKGETHVAGVIVPGVTSRF
jgi:hypothetical protein